MNLTKFKEHYTIISQEPTYSFFHVILSDEVDEGGYLTNYIEDYDQLDETADTGGGSYFFIEDKNGVEVFSTDNEHDVFRKVIELTKELENN